MNVGSYWWMMSVSIRERLEMARRRTLLVWALMVLVSALHPISLSHTSQITTAIHCLSWDNKTNSVGPRIPMFNISSTPVSALIVSSFLTIQVSDDEVILIYRWIFVFVKTKYYFFLKYIKSWVFNIETNIIIQSILV